MSLIFFLGSLPKITPATPRRDVVFDSLGTFLLFDRKNWRLVGRQPQPPDPRDGMGNIKHP